MSTVFRRVGLGLAAVLLASSASLAQAAQDPCFNEAAMQSARIHDLRVMLMVNALKCRVRHPETLRSYGELIDQRGWELNDHSKLVQLNLSQQYGEAQGPVAYNRYETALANYHSIPYPSQTQCDDVATYIELAKRADHAELEMLSRLVTLRTIDVCLIPVSGSDAERAGVPDRDQSKLAAFDPRPQSLGPKPSVRTAAAEPATQLVDGIPTYNVPGTGPNTAPEPLETVDLPAAGAAPAEPAAQSARPALAADQKLDQAIVALSAAVAALSELRQQP